jgi:hypothetical protein
MALHHDRSSRLRKMWSAMEPTGRRVSVADRLWFAAACS